MSETTDEAPPAEGPEEVEAAAPGADEAATPDVEGGAEAAGEAPQGDPARQELAALKRELAAAHDMLRHYSQAVDRAKAEFEASRARLEREQARVVEAQKVAAVSGLLGVLDSLDQALAAPGDGGFAFLQGVAMIRNQFDGALRDLGLERFDAVGEVFDPERHEAVTTQDVEDAGQDGLVVREIRAGAQVHGKVVRPAAVVVGRYLGAREPAEA
jgi:molecular chaperone GrpE